MSLINSFEPAKRFRVFGYFFHVRKKQHPVTSEVNIKITSNIIFGDEIKEYTEKIYMTKDLGTIVLTSDGTSIQVNNYQTNTNG